MRAQGLEFETELQLARGIHSLASYSLQRARDQETANADQLAVAPGAIPAKRARPHTAFVSLSEIQHISSRATLAGNTIASATVMNATLILPLGRPLELIVGVRNLFDQRAYDPGSEEHLDDAIEKNGRTFRVGIRWIFMRQ